MFGGCVLYGNQPLPDRWSLVSDRSLRATEDYQLITAPQIEELRDLRGTLGLPGTVAPFRAWRGSRDLVAQSPKFHVSTVAHFASATQSLAHPANLLQFPPAACATFRSAPCRGRRLPARRRREAVRSTSSPRCNRKTLFRSCGLASRQRRTSSVAGRRDTSDRPGLPAARSGYPRTRPGR
jgi:hypothetical protein